MKYKIEKKLPQRTDTTMRYGDFHDFLRTLKQLNVGESFVFPRLHSNHRLALGMMHTLMGRKYITNKEGAGYRVGRVL